MAPAGSYSEHAPPPAVASSIACVWTRTVGSDAEGSVRVLPDACVDIVWQRGHGAFVAGPDTSPKLVAAEPGTVFAGVRFRPGAGGAALGLPLAELRDRRGELAELDPRLADRLDPDLLPGEAVRLLTGAAARMARAGAPDPAVGEAARALASPATRVVPLAAALGLSERQLRRRCEAAVGYGPKTLQRVLRFQTFLARLEARGPTVELAEAALDAGYADQAHLTRESARLAGLTPAALARLRLAQAAT